MKKLFALMVLLFCISLSNIVQAQEDCPTPTTFVCDRTQVVQLRLQVDLRRQNLQRTYDMIASHDRAEIEPRVEQYRQELNDLRLCQRSLGQAPTSCGMSLSIKNPLNDRYFLVQTSFNISEYDGICTRRESTRDQNIVNDQGSSIANSMNGHWNFQNIRPICHSTGTVGASTERNLSFRGYDSAYPGSKGYFQVIDWAESENDDESYKVSQHWARQIQMGAETTLSFRADGDLLKFEFSNGAYIHLDGNRQVITDSNFLSLDHFDSGQCRTNETAVGRGTAKQRVRFSPALQLSAPYNNLRINTIRG